MEHNKDSEAYAKLFIKFSDSVQQVFRKVFVVLLVCLFLSQLLLRIPGIREVLSAAERWEGERPRAFLQTNYNEDAN